MTENKATKSEEKDGQTIDLKKQTTGKTSQKKTAKSQTTVKWSVVTETETKVIVAKAAKKANKGIFEWVDEKLREAGVAALTKQSQPPAKVEDIVEDLLTRYTDRLKAEQAETIKAQNDLIERQGEQLKQLTEAIGQQPTSLKELIFGKSKKE